ncbi:hypothetical protein PT974_01689 [Cladobotryum mycophilum]|uniref:Thioredoxin domain-containing protein n=1 Tax=Cladobotryum mycophilum TaxID=491253 RepID=A0ABR0SVY7_9HYPO
MPLIDVDVPPTTTTDTHYVVYFASGEPLGVLIKVFGDDSAPTAHIVRVGQRSEWKGNLQNKYRNEPYNIQGVPTVVKIEYGKEVARLGDESQNESDLRKLIARGQEQRPLHSIYSTFLARRRFRKTSDLGDWRNVTIEQDLGARVDDVQGTIEWSICYALEPAPGYFDETAKESEPVTDDS